MKKLGIGIFIILACMFVTFVVRRPKEKEVKKSVTTEMATEDETMTEAPTETTTEEEYTEAPRDTSDWETQKPADTSPDTGAPIK